jgi:Holliday junction resolvase-like predicted endonuclease
MGRKAKGTSDTQKTEQQQGKDPSGAANKVSREQRLEMIRTAAYHLAEKRDFKPGAEMDDWLEAEQDLKDPTPTDDL